MLKRTPFELSFLLDCVSRVKRITSCSIFILYSNSSLVQSPKNGELSDLQWGMIQVSNIITLSNCSRNGVHAVARLIMAHPKIPEDCKVSVSRKPCSFCTKLFVQAKVERVFYLTNRLRARVFYEQIVNEAQPS